MQIRMSTDLVKVVAGFSLFGAIFLLFIIAGIVGIEFVKIGALVSIGMLFGIWGIIFSIMLLYVMRKIG